MSTPAHTSCDDCGWTGKPGGYRSPAQAAYAHRRHSCERSRRDRAAYEKAMARHAAIDRTPQPCTHPQTRHEHGTHACYVHDRCRCIPCTTANTHYEAQRARRHAYGHHTLTDADPIRTHVRQLQAAGMGLKRIAEVSGVAHGALWKLMYGKTRPDGTRTPSRRVRNETAQALLKVTAHLEALAPVATVDPTGTRRRLEALTALGWAINRLADEHHLDRQLLDAALRGRPVQARNAQAVRTMYEAIGDTRPTASSPGQARGITLALRRAAEHGWLPPAMWDDDQLDDPYGDVPDGYGRPDNPNSRRPEPRLDLDEWLHLVQGGEHPERAATRCGVTLSAVWHAARRHNRDDVQKHLRDQEAA